VLRTGGIHEKWFAVSASRFLFQTLAHSHAERVRPEHRDLLDDAAADSSDYAIVLRASAKVGAAIAKVVAAIEVNRWEHVEEIASLHIWTADSVRTGWTFDPNTGSLCWWCRQPAGRAAAAGSHAGLRGMHQLGATTGIPRMGRAGARRRYTAERC
jgi:hypothetical protein